MMAWQTAIPRIRAEKSGVTSVRADAIAAQLPRDVRKRLHVTVNYLPSGDKMMAYFVEAGKRLDEPTREWSCALEGLAYGTVGYGRPFYKIPDAFLALLCLEV